MNHRAHLTHHIGLRARLDFARLLETPEDDVAENVRALESQALYQQLSAAGVVTVDPYAAARFAARRFAGRELRATSESSALALDGNSAEVALISRIGQEAFEDIFLGSKVLTDRERAALSKMTEAEARSVRQFVDRIYLSGELAGGQAQAAPSEAFSSVAGISLEDDRPVLSFFHREIWKGRYRINRAIRDSHLSALDHAAAQQARILLRALEQIDRRKATLYRVLEEVLAAQARYFVTRNAEDRQPLTQRDLARKLELSPSVINRVVSNKAIELPWGVEVPLAALLPNRKSVLKDHVFELSHGQPQLSDRALADVIERRFSLRLSQQSISVYRREMGATRAAHISRTEVRKERAAAVA
jgi:hypothetical protein